MNIPAEDWFIYAVKMKHQNIAYSSPSTIVPIVAGAHCLTSKERNALRNSGHVFDDEGENISSLNPFFCELTAIYWQIHHCDHPLTGVAHYRRKWDDQCLIDSKKVLYVQKPLVFPCNVAQQLMDCCKSFDAPRITMSLAERGLMPFTASEMSAFWNQNVLHAALMARGPQEHYKKMMTLVFEALWPIWEENEEELRTIQGYDRRMMGFLGERMMSALLLFKDKFFDFPIADSPVHLVQ
jgi:hypothetical protein